jgi:cellulose synthase/poly-beta-1,6-N-acetylglucosamine synthase-like glycosyltransferase
VTANYILITPAKNEQDFIGRTIESVLAQSILPREWIIVSDGSIDGTDAIVERYCRDHSFLRLVRMERGQKRNFSAKVAAFRAGLQTSTCVDYDFVGNLDADVSFAPDYFERLFKEFCHRPGIGLAGGLILERIGDDYCPQRIHCNSVAGAVQMFRRSCFEAIGGYTPISSGGVDAAAEITVRMRGWEVKTIRELQVYHHRRVATGSNNVFKTRFRQGINHALLGYHPLFQILNSTYHVIERPYLIGSLVTLSGYFWGCVRNPKKVLPRETVEFLRTEQLQRIKNLQAELTHRVRATTSGA